MGIEANEEKKALSIVMERTEDISQFADLVAVEANNEAVYLSFIQGMRGCDPDTKEPQGRLVTRVVLTWPHFVRVHEMIARTVQERKNAAREAAEKALS